MLILDGQQRITSLYGITRGQPPAFFQGDEKAFSGLRFNVEDETFEFYASAKMRDDPRWVDVTSLFTQGLEHHIGVLNARAETQPRIIAYMERPWVGGRHEAAGAPRPQIATKQRSCARLCPTVRQCELPM